MKLLCLAVRDVKAEHYSRPFFALALGEALRNFMMECENPESLLHRFPDDFRLFRIGEFDQISGKLEGCLPVEVACARDFVKVEIGRQLELLDKEG